MHSVSQRISFRRCRLESRVFFYLDREVGEVMDAEAEPVEPVEPVEHELMSRLHHLYILCNYSVYIYIIIYNI